MTGSYTPQYNIKLNKFIRDNYLTVSIIIFSLIGLLARVAIRHKVSDDYIVFLQPWFDEIARDGGIKALLHQVGNYNLPYQTIIAVLTYIPINSLYLYKGLSCIFDYILAISAGYIARMLSTSGDETENGLAFLIGYAAVLLSPVVIINSAGWAQCDSIWASFCLITILLVLRGHSDAALFMSGVALSFKLQAVFILPALLILVANGDLRVRSLLLLPVGFVVPCIPAILLGASPSRILSVYIGQTSTYPQVWMSYPSFWAMVFPNAESAQIHYDLGFGGFALLIAAALVTLQGILYVVERRRCADNMDLVILFLVVSLLCVEFMPSMHERYGYLGEVLLLIIAIHERRIIIPALVINAITLIAYSDYLFCAESAGITWPVLGLLNLVVLSVVVLICNSIMLGESEPPQRER